MNGHSEVIVVGGGHNGLVAAVLLARAGRSVRLLERAGHLGGASIGKQVFPGQPARLSQYSYLVSLLPDALAAELRLPLELRSRAVSSYTPLRRGGRDLGLLVEREPGPATEASFAEVTGSPAAWTAWQRFYRRVDAFAKAVGPALDGPLSRRAEVRDRVTALAGADTWDDLVERPLSEVLEREFADDLVRGVVATDGLIGIDTSLSDPGLAQNRCFLYHVAGNSSGEWRVPVGGMGALADALTAAAQAAGVEIHTDTPVDSVRENGNRVEVSTVDGREFSADHLLAAVAPAVLDRLLGRPATDPEGSQLKVNLLLRRLPRLRSGADPRQAFAGTLHLGESYAELESAHALATQGKLPNPLPCEVYCHSLTDPSILGPLAAEGYHTLTLFGLHAPARLFREHNRREEATAAALAALQHHLAEPLSDVLATDADGNPCVQASTPVDLERDLGMPGGHIFHGDLSWPWLAEEEPADTPAQRWGVAVPGLRRVLLAGAGSRRGGGVSGLGGLAAARVVTDSG
ncbi:phytoene desaturase family protein [Crossiella cryophila]|uniref:Pyridine nucleotide-disulfide oxidoreductase domain-containing protein 2 n=1 Tax=Crossiella cryophila TaxID=43355 RepID=A0A7W7CJF5_9PSEU|nr:NAD(P)/FAD-dependent oxidoreductase [Crossiella cryophila]MBB4682067.1 phytoene dehydrogenase-like protein [Crossiella cryophila]